MPTPRIAGLDSIRFLLAFWVLLSHYGLPPLPFDRSTPVGWFLSASYGFTINGPAAVIVFFVISGFCIHLPYRNDPPASWPRYYVRRFVRILPPVLAAAVLAHCGGLEMSMLDDSILWSVVCEEIYYAIYPVLRVLIRWLGWPILLTVAFVISVCVTLTDPTAKNYPSYGWYLNWALGLACWLLGCLLAEQSDSLIGPISRKSIWSWRFAVWLGSTICLILRFHSPIGYPHTLNWFAVLAYFWLRQEICYWKTRQPWRLCEWAGRWSYSLYLVHYPVGPFLPSPRVFWVLPVSYAFYLAFEKPSHLLARWLGRPRELSPPSSVGIEHVKISRSD
jgi:peptidoglycan/LPS O-acetylase OafA/YrhL